MTGPGWRTRILVPVATEVFDRVLGDRLNQLEVRPPVPTDVSGLLDTDIPDATRTMDGLRLNVSVALQYLEAWLGGRGAVAISTSWKTRPPPNSRSQLWQWVHHGSTLSDGTVVTPSLVGDELDAAVKTLTDEGLDSERLAAAASLVREVALAEELPDFLTVVAEAQLR